MNKYDERSRGKKHAYAFQQKIVLRYLQSIYSGKERAMILTSYLAICWVASDFSKGIKIVNNWPRTISTYSGIGIGTAQKCLRKLNEIGLIKYARVKNDKGRWDKWQAILVAELPGKLKEWANANGHLIDGYTTNSEINTL